MDRSAVRCAGLVKRYGDVTAVDGLSLAVERGECFGLLGPNGAGKTTTVEILEGLTRPDAGSVEILGLTWEQNEREIREQLGIQLQEARTADKLTVIETIRLFRSFYRDGRDPVEVLRLVGLEDKARSWVRRLSGGQRQRLSLACALVARPAILFLDEPTTGLDPQSRRQAWEIVATFRADGGTVVLTTHYMEEAERLCDRVAILDRGRIIAEGSPRELIAGLGAAHVVELSLGAEPDHDALLALPGVRAAARTGDVVRVTVDELHRGVPALLAELVRQRVDLTGLATHHASLEDVFVTLTGRHLREE